MARALRIVMSHEPLPRDYYDAVSAFPDGVDDAMWEGNADREEARIKGKYPGGVWKTLR